MAELEYKEPPMSELVELIAKAINGPSNLNMVSSPVDLGKLREVKWAHLSSQEQGELIFQARGVVLMLDTYCQRDEAYWDGVVRRIKYDMGIS